MTTPFKPAVPQTVPVAPIHVPNHPRPEPRDASAQGQTPASSTKRVSSKFAVPALKPPPLPPPSKSVPPKINPPAPLAHPHPTKVVSSRAGYVHVKKP